MATRSKLQRSITTRSATRADLDMLIRLVQSYYAFDRIPFNKKALRAALLMLLRDKSAGWAFLVCAASRPIGYTVLTHSFDLEFGGRVALMTDLYLEAPYRGLGIGRKTLRFLQRFCRDLGIEVLELQVERRNKSARSFYRSLGFAAYDRIPMSKRISGSRPRPLRLN